VRGEIPPSLKEIWRFCNSSRDGGNDDQNKGKDLRILGLYKAFVNRE